MSNLIFLARFWNNCYNFFSQARSADASEETADRDDASGSASESRCPMCRRQNWNQLDQEMWRMDRWMEYASGSLKSSQDVSTPTSIEHLEDAIQVCRILTRKFF